MAIDNERQPVHRTGQTLREPTRREGCGLPVGPTGMGLVAAPGLPIGQVSLDPVFGWYAVLPLAVLMLASLWLTLSTQGISLRGRLALMGLRLAAVAILLLGWLRPGFVSTIERESAGAIAVLMDRSESMTLPSGSGNRSRWEVQQDVWAAIRSATDLQIGQTKIVPYFYDARPFPASADELPGLEKSFSKRPAGRATDLGAALAEVGRLQLDPPLRGVILMGDAAQTVLPPSISATNAARTMAQLDQPVLVVGIGPQGEKSQFRDVAIEGMPEHYSAFVKKELSVRLVVSAQGMQNQPIQLKLRLRASGQEEKIVASREVLASRANEKLPVEFTILVEDEGEYLLEATAEVEAREQIETNNLALSFITVREGGVNILYLEGEPRYEQTFLKRSLNESLDFDVQYAWFPKLRRRRGPIDITQSANVREYDAIILGDLEAKALSRQTTQQIVSRVRAGAGLLLLGGYHSFDAGGYGSSPLATLFPVELTQGFQPLDRAVDRRFHIEGDIKLRPTVPHPITTLLPEPDNTRLWERLKPLNGMNRLGSRTASPGVQVLIDSDQGDPVLVKGQYGRGRVLAFAGDSTWQWWRTGHRKVHQQFWRQALLWLIQRDSMNEGFRLDLDRRRLLIDETPDLAIEWFGGTDEKPMPTNVRVELTRDGQRLRRLPTTTTGEGRQKAKIVGLDQPGLYAASLKAEGADGESYETEIAFIVRDESLELSRPGADWQMMKSIAEANRSERGKRVFLPEEVGEAISWLRERQEATKVTTLEKRRLGDAAWDAWLYLAIFCVLMSVEWGLRKSWQLP